MPKCLVIRFDITDIKDAVVPKGTKILSRVPHKDELIKPDSAWNLAVRNIINAQLREHPKIKLVLYTSNQKER